MSLPLNGNQYFNQVQNIASAQLQRVQVDELRTTKMTVSGSSINNGPFTTVTVTGYANIIGTTTFGVTLTSAPGIAPAAVNSSNALILPANAILSNIYMSNNGTALVGGTSSALMTTAAVSTGAAAPTSVQTFGNGIALAKINSGSEYPPTSVAAGIGAISAGGGVYLTLVETGVYTAGNYKVVLEYTIPNTPQTVLA